MASLQDKLLVHTMRPDLVSMVESFVEMGDYITGLSRLLAAVKVAEDNLTMCSDGSGGGILIRLKEPFVGTHTSLPGQILTGGSASAVVQNSVQTFGTGIEIWQLRVGQMKGKFVDGEIATAGNGTSGEVLFTIDNTLGTASAKATATLGTAEAKQQAALIQIEEVQTAICEIMDKPKPFDTSSVSSLIAQAESGTNTLNSICSEYTKGD